MRRSRGARCSVGQRERHFCGHQATQLLVKLINGRDVRNVDQRAVAREAVVTQYFQNASLTEGRIELLCHELDCGHKLTRCLRVFHLSCLDLHALHVVLFRELVTESLLPLSDTGDAVLLLIL